MDATIDPVHPFDFSRLYGDEKYSLQNMLLKQYGMVYEVKGDDWINSVYSDQVHNEWQEACKLLKSHDSGDAFLAGTTNESFMAFASKVFSLIEGREIKLTGAAVIRHTNQMGYPVLQLIGIISSQKVTGMAIIKSLPHSKLWRLDSTDNYLAVADSWEGDNGTR